MKEKFIEPLQEAGELIASDAAYTICGAIKNADIWDCEEFRAFDPGVHPTRCWWGWMTMSNTHSSDECRNARLLGIAFMLTMPEDMCPKTFSYMPE